MVFSTGDPAVGKALNSAPGRMPTCISLPADRENLLEQWMMNATHQASWLPFA